MIYLFHGLIGDADHYRFVAEKLCAKGYRVCVPNLDFETHDVDYYQDKFQAQVDADGARAVFVGNSLGCVLAQKLTAPRAGYVLSAPPFDYDNATTPIERGKSEAYIKTLYYNHGTLRDEERFVASATAKLDQMMANRGMIRRLRSLRAQCLAFTGQDQLHAQSGQIQFVIGAQDFTTPTDAFKSYYKVKAPKAAVSVLKDCGHAIPVEQPTKFANIIAKRAMLVGVPTQDRGNMGIDSRRKGVGVPKSYPEQGAAQMNHRSNLGNLDRDSVESGRLRTDFR